MLLVLKQKQTHWRLFTICMLATITWETNNQPPTNMVATFVHLFLICLLQLKNVKQVLLLVSYGTRALNLLLCKENQMNLVVNLLLIQQFGSTKSK
jgi:hypothetical protein